MGISSCPRFALVGMVLLSYVFGSSLAQDTKNSDQRLEGAIITKPAPLIYPPLARQTRITGNVELKLEIRPDGSVASADVVSGHPLLRQLALENAQQSQFACIDCRDAVHAYRLVYTFEMVPTTDCGDPNDQSHFSERQSYPRLTQSQGQVTIVDRTVIICESAETLTRIRSAKCLYLWKCGIHHSAANE